MKSYIIKRSTNVSEGNIAVIGKYKWVDNGYEPYAEGRAVFNGDTLYVRLTAEEKNPCAKFSKPYEKVWLDSCVEFFFGVNDSEMFFNFECNSLGAYIINYGLPKSYGKERVPISEIFAEKPKADIYENFWTVNVAFSFREIMKIAKTEKIDFLRGNFYKCGDETDFPHFGMWSEILSKKPDFHIPDYFGYLYLEK